MRTFTKLFTLVAASSSVEAQMLAIRDGTGQWEQTLKSWLLGGNQFDWVGEHRNWRVPVPKVLPPTIKLKYPDICFALQALSLHVGGNKYYKEWEKVKQYLTFKKKDQVGTYYRFWHIDDQKLETLKSGKALVLEDRGNNWASYTRKSSLFGKTKDGHTVLDITTEQAMQTRGQGLFLVTKHTFAPIFDLFHFIVHILNMGKRVFGTELQGLQTLSRYSSEQEVIGPAVSKIEPRDVYKVFRNGAEFKLEDHEVLVTFRPAVDRGIYGKEGPVRWRVSTGIVAAIQEYLAKYNGEIDIAFQNKYIVTNVPEKSHYKRYADQPGLIESKELSKLAGTKMWVGYWK